ncbi:MAG: hypothetical protein HZA66_22300 [Rhodopseudomonas palustris]|uniref:Uncharacterized protein n=1 Tax=Rhodopseudomonas palustris TaxID=1076 RepID=A0A933VWJ0_RHOPL|nr:hypothetical protein [Rhodopseudomonas palustris]
MTQPDLTQAYLEWTKQKLDESAATIAKIEEAAAEFSGASSAKAEEALAQFRAARDDFQAKVTALQADLGGSKQVTDAALSAVSAQWTEVELAFQKFLGTAGDQAGVVKDALAARAEAQRRALVSSLETIQTNAAAALEQGRKEMETSVRRWTEQTEKALGPKLTELSAAGDETLKALKAGMDETAAVYEKTWARISQAFTKTK